MHGFFHWQYAGVLIPLFWTLGATMLGVALTTSANIAPQAFGLTYLFVLLATIWTAGYWFTSDLVAKHRPRAKRADRRKQQKRKYEFVRFGGVVVITALGIASVSYTRAFQTDKELTGLQGRLYPGTYPIPPNPCNGIVPAGGIIILLGRIAAFTTSFPHTILMIDDTPAIVVDRQQDGALGVSVDVRDADGKIIVQLGYDGYTVNSNNILHFRRHDRSTLSVIDQYGSTVLSARYLNSHAFSLSTTLKLSHDREVVIPDSQYASLCSGNNGLSDYHIALRQR